MGAVAMGAGRVRMQACDVDEEDDTAPDAFDADLLHICGGDWVIVVYVIGREGKNVVRLKRSQGRVVHSCTEGGL